MCGGNQRKGKGTKRKERGKKGRKEGWFQKGCFEGTGCLHHGCDPVSHRPALLLVRPQHLPGSHRDPSGVWVGQGLRNLFPAWLLWLHQNVSAARVFSDAQALYSLGLCRRDSPGRQSKGHKECHPALGLNQVTTTTTTPPGGHWVEQWRANCLLNPLSKLHTEQNERLSATQARMVCLGTLRKHRGPRAHFLFCGSLSWWALT